MANRYEEGKIYALYIDGIEECYVGSTCNKLPQRLSQHMFSHTCESQTKTKGCALFDKGEVKIKLLEAYPCDSKDKLLLKEREWLEKTPSAINKNVPGRGWQEERQMNAPKYAAKMKEWREANTEHTKNYDKKYREEHKEQTAESKTAWRKANADKIKLDKQSEAICVICQHVTTKGNMWRHKKEKHPPAA
jgi:hypothetical protein